MKEKDLILLTTYTPDSQRKNILLEALKSIDKNKFDIMISSHSSIPEEALEYCDYFIYDKNNTLLFTPEHKLSFWFSCDNFRVYTTECKDYNHIIAAGSLTINGLSSAKNFGYTKVHWFDYDTIFSDDSELIENSTLLDSHSIIWYKHPDLIAFSGMSFNLNKINQDWFNTSNDVFHSFLNASEIKTYEYFNYSLIEQENNTFEKSLLSLQDKINVSRYSADEPDWAVVVYNEVSEDFIFFNFNKTGTDNNINIVINNSQIKSILTQQKQSYYTESIGKAKDIQYIKIIMNNKVIKDYDFSIINKEEYILKNKIQYE
jgi:hypothetical protein